MIKIRVDYRVPSGPGFHAFRAEGAFLSRLWVLFTLFSFWMSAPVFAGSRVFILRSSELSLYEDATKSFRRCTKAEVVGDSLLGDEGPKRDAAFNDIQSKSPDVVLAMGSAATRAARERFPKTTVVFCMVLDPSSSGIAPPGVALELKASAQIELIQKFPKLQRIGVIHNPARTREMFAELKALQGKGAQIVFQPAASPEALDAAIQSLVGKVDCLLMVPDLELYSPQIAPQVILKTLQSGLPLVAPSPAYVKAGALLGVYASPDEMGCLAAEEVERLSAGGKPSYTWPSKVRTAVNTVVADRLKVTVPPSVTNNSDQVIK